MRTFVYECLYFCFFVIFHLDYNYYTIFCFLECVTNPFALCFYLWFFIVICTQTKLLRLMHSFFFLIIVFMLSMVYRMSLCFRYLILLIYFFNQLGSLLNTFLIKHLHRYTRLSKIQYFIFPSLTLNNTIFFFILNSFNQLISCCIIIYMLIRIIFNRLINWYDYPQ